MDFVVGTVTNDDVTKVSLTEVNTDGSATGFIYEEDELNIKGCLTTDKHGRLVLTGFKPDKDTKPAHTDA